ncbi:MAG: histidine kinase dimerization/phospho-acceptor domain-containing protein, partial [Sinobacterium sp.]
MFQDSQERLWIGNNHGLYLLNENLTAYELYDQYFSVADNREIRFIHEDTKGFLWLVTPTSISKFNPNNGDLQHFDHRDGLPDARYFLFPTASIKDDTIYLPTRLGIYYFDTKNVSGPSLAEDILLTNFEVLGTEQNYNLATLQNTGIRLTHRQNNLKFDFATMDLLNARQINYSYKLDGFDQEWLESGHNSSVTYTNLAGGDYTFQVRAAAKKDLWYKNELAINIYIATVWWQQWWMYLVYLCSVLLGINYYLKEQKRSVSQVERQIAEKTASIALESSKISEANKIKTLFLANMSHEIRTPLTTVIGQAEAIICREVAPEEIYKEVAIIHDSSLYLLALINDMLDLTQIEENRFKLELVPQDLHELLNHINTMFNLQANVKGLNFTLDEELSVPFFVNIDGLRLKQILINLCSNALKFT